MTKTMAQNKSHCFDQGGRPSWTELERGEGTNLWRRAGEAMCSPASEAHSSGGGSRAEYREKGSCQPCKSHPETSAVESETCPAMYSSAGPPNQPTPCGAELGAWELNWSVWAAQTRGKQHTRIFFLCGYRGTWWDLLCSQGSAWGWRRWFQGPHWAMD